MVLNRTRWPAWAASEDCPQEVEGKTGLEAGKSQGRSGVWLGTAGLSSACWSAAWSQADN